MQTLYPDIVNHLAEYLAVQDIVNISKTCKQLRHLLSTDDIWKPFCEKLIEFDKTTAGYFVDYKAQHNIPIRRRPYGYGGSNHSMIKSYNDRKLYKNNKLICENVKMFDDDHGRVLIYTIDDEIYENVSNYPKLTRKQFILQKNESIINLYINCISDRPLTFECKIKTDMSNYVFKIEQTNHR